MAVLAFWPVTYSLEGTEAKVCGRLRGKEVLSRGQGCCRKASWVPGRQTGADRQKGQPVVAGDLLPEAGSSVSGLPWLQGWGGGCPYQAPKPHSLLGAGLPRGSGSLRLPGHRALRRAHTQRAAPRGHGCAHPCPFRSLACVRPGTAGLPHRVCLFLRGLGLVLPSFMWESGAEVETVLGAGVLARLVGPREVVGQQSRH